MEALLIPTVPATVRDPKTPPAAGVLLDLGLGLVTVTALVFFFSASLRLFF